MKYLFEKIISCQFCDSSDFIILGKRLNSAQGMRPKNKIGITTTIVKCKQCGLIFSNPMPIPDNLQEHYGIPPENYWTSEYFNIPDNYMDDLIAWMNTIQKIESGAKILDIGAGLGFTMIAFERHDYIVYGIEPSEPFYERSITKMGINPNRLIKSSIEDYQNLENTFDVIIFASVLEHLYKPAEAINKVMKWLKPNGLVYIEAPSAKWLTNKLGNFFYKLTGSDYVSNLSPMHAPYHLYEFSKRSFEIHGLKNNYEIADYRYYLRKTYLPKAFDRILHWYMKKTNTGMEIALWLRKKQI